MNGNLYFFLPMKNVKRKNASGLTSIYVRLKASKYVAGFASVKRKKIIKINDF